MKLQGVHFIDFRGGQRFGASKNALYSPFTVPEGCWSHFHLRLWGFSLDLECFNLLSRITALRF